MRNPRDFLQPLAVGAPAPLAEIPTRASRMVHFFDPSSEKMRGRVPRMLSEVDILLGNLEDAIPVERKEAAREGLIAVSRAHDFGDTQLWTRVNSLDSPWFLDDMLDLVDAIGDRLDVIMLPKVNGPWDVQFVDQLLAQLEARRELSRPILLHAILETAAGVANVEAIATASPRMQGMSLGPSDLAASRRMKTTRVGGPHPGYVVRDDADPGAARRAPRDLHAGPVALHAGAHGRRLRGQRHLPVLRPLRRLHRRRGLRGPVPRRLHPGLRGGVDAAPAPDRDRAARLPAGPGGGRLRAAGRRGDRRGAGRGWPSWMARCRTTRPTSRRACCSRRPN